MAQVSSAYETGTSQTSSMDSGMDELEHEWVFWFSEKQTGKQVNQQDYEKGNKVLGTFKTITDFWNCWNSLDNFQKFPEDSNLKLFKKGISPTWEDPMNDKGGRWSLFFPKGERSEVDHKNHVIDIWKPMTLSLIGEGFGHSDYLTGSIVSLRHKGITLSLWVRNFDDNPLVLEEVGKELIDITGISEWKYQSHEAWSESASKFVDGPAKPTVYVPKFKQKERIVANSDGEGEFTIYTNKKPPAPKPKKSGQKNKQNNQDSKKKDTDGSSHEKENGGPLAPAKEFSIVPPGFSAKEKSQNGTTSSEELKATPAPEPHSEPTSNPTSPPEAPKSQHNGTNDGSYLLAPTTSWGDLSSDEFSSGVERERQPQKNSTKVVQMNIVLENPGERKNKDKNSKSLRKTAVQNQTDKNQKQPKETKSPTIPKNTQPPSPKAAKATAPYDPRVKPTVSFRDAILNQKTEEKQVEQKTQVISPTPSTVPSTVTEKSSSDTTPKEPSSVKSSVQPPSHAPTPPPTPTKAVSNPPPQPSNQVTDVTTKVETFIQVTSPQDVVYTEKSNKKNKKKSENTEKSNDQIAVVTVTVRETVQVDVKPDNKIEEVVEDEAKDVPQRRNSLKKDNETAQEIAQMLEKLEQQKETEEKEKKKKKKKKKVLSVAEKEKKKEEELAEELDRTIVETRQKDEKKTVTFPLAFHDKTTDVDEMSAAKARERKKKEKVKQVEEEPKPVNVFMNRQKAVEAVLYLLLVALIFFVIIYVLQLRS